jgi:RHS repeat-associated protein
VSYGYTAFAYDPNGSVVWRVRRVDNFPLDVVALDAFCRLWADVSTGIGGPGGQYSFNSAYSVNYGGQAGYYTEPNTRLDANDPGYRGLILCTYRYFDPAKARWINRDPIGYAGDVNLYAFVGGNPVMGADPDGLDGKGSSSPWFANLQFAIGTYKGMQHAGIEMLSPILSQNNPAMDQLLKVGDKLLYQAGRSDMEQLGHKYGYVTGLVAGLLVGGGEEGGSLALEGIVEGGGYEYVWLHHGTLLARARTLLTEPPVLEGIEEGTARAVGFSTAPDTLPGIAYAKGYAFKKVDSYGGVPAMLSIKVPRPFANLARTPEPREFIFDESRGLYQELVELWPYLEKRVVPIRR